MKIDELAGAYGQIVQIRLLEERISTLYADGAIPGFVHTSPGPEACAVGALVHARGSDVITSTRRGHCHVVAKGLEPRRLLADVIGKQAGAYHSRGGSMHVADPSIGIFGANGIVGAGLPIAVGAAHALRGRDCGDVVVCLSATAPSRPAPSMSPSTPQPFGGCPSSSSARTTASRSSPGPMPSTPFQSSHAPAPTA